MARGQSANLSVDVVANTKEAQRDLASFTGKVAGFSAGVTAAVTSAGITAITAAASSAASFLVDSVGNAADLNAALATTQKLYGAAAGDVEAWARAAAESLGLSTRQALGFANQLSTYGTQLGLTGGELAEWSESIATVAADLGAFRDVDTAQVMADIGSAFRGERDPIEKVGIALNDASVKAAYFRATGEEVEGTLTNQQNIIGTLQAIQEQAAPAAGAYADEQGQLAGQSQEASAQLENLSDTVGAYFLPAVELAAQWVNETLLPAMKDLGGYIVNDLWPTMKDLAGTIGEKLAPYIDLLRIAWEELQPALQDAYAEFQDVWTIIGPLVTDVAKLAGPIALGLLVVVIGSVAAGLVTFAQILKVLAAVFDFFEPEIRRITAWFTALKDAVVWVVESLMSLISWAGKAASSFDWLNPIGGAIGAITGNSRSAGSGSAGPALYGAGGYTYSPTFVINAKVPLGVHAGDVGAAILAELQGLEARRGPLPLTITPRTGL